MGQYKVIHDSPVFAYVNGELEHDFPKRTIKRGQVIEGETAMLLLTNPEKGSLNMKFLRLADDKFIKFKNVKQMNNKQNFSNAAGVIRKKPKCNCTSASIYFGECKDPNCAGGMKVQKAKNDSFNVGGDDVDAPMTTGKRTLIGTGIGAGVGLAIAALTGTSKLAWIGAVGAVGAVISYMTSGSEIAQSIVNTPDTTTPPPSNTVAPTTDSTTSNAAGSMRKKPCISPYCKGSFNASGDSFSQVHGALMGRDLAYRKPCWMDRDGKKIPCKGNSFNAAGKDKLVYERK